MPDSEERTVLWDLVQILALWGAIPQDAAAGLLVRLMQAEESKCSKEDE